MTVCKIALAEQWGNTMLNKRSHRYMVLISQPTQVTRQRLDERTVETKRSKSVEFAPGWKVWKRHLPDWKAGQRNSINVLSHNNTHSDHKPTPVESSPS